MNVNQLKEKLGKIKTSVLYKNILNEKLFTYLKDRTPLYVDEAGLTNNQQN